MKPKGWRLDPAWVEHYSKIDRERIEREIERVKMAHQSVFDELLRKYELEQAQRPLKGFRKWWLEAPGCV